MNTSHILMLSAFLALTSGSLVLAEEPAVGGSPTQGVTTPTGTSPTSALPTGQPLGKVDVHAQRIRQALNLTNEQLAVWQRFEDTWREQSKAIVQAQQTRTDFPMTAPERLQRQITLMEQRLNAMKAISVAQQALYQALTPQQQRIMDTLAPGAGSSPGAPTGASSAPNGASGRGIRK
ncbi:putative Spy/CpxP family protein refolding chaperone [Gammaproteobacteria bacterium]